MRTDGRSLVVGRRSAADLGLWRWKWRPQRTLLVRRTRLAPGTLRTSIDAFPRSKIFAWSYEVHTRTWPRTFGPFDRRMQARYPKARNPPALVPASASPVSQPHPQPQALTPKSTVYPGNRPGALISPASCRVESRAGALLHRVYKVRHRPQRSLSTLVDSFQWPPWMEMNFTMNPANQVGAFRHSGYTKIMDSLLYVASSGIKHVARSWKATYKWYVA